MNNKLKSIFNNLIFSISFLVLFSLLIVSTFQSTFIRLNEKVTFLYFDYYWILFLFLHVIFLFFIIKNKNIINEKIFFVLLTTIYILIAGYLIINISPIIRADANIVYKVANQLRNGIYDYFNPGMYMNYYPHQLGLVYYNYLLGFISYSTKFIFFVNFIEVVAINYAMYRIIKILSKNNKLKILIGIYLSFAFTPQLLFISFAYGLIPGFLFMIYGVLNILKFNKYGKIKNLILSIIFLIISCLIRNNFIIAVIAIAIYEWITLDNKKIIALKFLLGFLILNSATGFLLKNITSHITNIKISKGMPKILWIAMGTDINNNRLGPGWYNGYHTNVLEDMNYNFDKAGKIGKEKVLQNIKEHLSSPLKSISFFSKKFVSTWNEPTFQSIWSGPQDRLDQINYSNITKSLYGEGNIFWINYEYMKATLYLIYLGIAIFLIKDYRKKYALFLIYFLGGVAFHLIWETKSQYVYPYVFLMIPLVVNGVEIIYKNHVNFNANKHYR
ncbi:MULTISPECIES: LTA synthase family protein [Helcococcus]|uniref:Glycosyltransferase RgtA/B/C/D-like domain-containing protein n=2 Tax=Helcococcus bovis TaxID=3153252 RepID=A0ABW9F816_9FIRM